MSKFIVLEGLDGSGKSTQIKLLKKYFDDNNIKFKYLHFPRMEEGIYGELVAKFLRGEYGDLNSVHPHLVTLLYAGDRNDAKPMVEEWMKDGYLVFIDRYIYSNIAYQCAKVEDEEKKIELRDWILNLEYEYNTIPKPDLTLFLDVPFSFTTNSLSNDRDGDDRDYLKGKKDIHEKDLGFQGRVRQEYLKINQIDENYKIINCSEDESSMLSPEKISSLIVNSIEEIL